MAAQLASITQALKDTNHGQMLLDDLIGYDWIEKAQLLAKETSQYRKQIHIANNIVNKIPAVLSICWQT